MHIADDFPFSIPLREEKQWHEDDGCDACNRSSYNDDFLCPCRELYYPSMWAWAPLRRCRRRYAVHLNAVFSTRAFLFVNTVCCVCERLSFHAST